MPSISKIPLVGLLFASSLLLVSASKAPPPLESRVSDILKQADRHYNKVQSMRLKVSRTLDRGMQSQEEKWLVTFQKPDSYRIEHEGPPKRIIVSQGDHFSEYIPQAKKALELDLNELSLQEREGIAASLMPRVAIPGFHLAITDDMYQKMNFTLVGIQTMNHRPSYFIEGKDKPSKDPKKKCSLGTMKIWIDQERLTLLRIEVYDGSSFMSSIEAKAFKEFENGYWIPSRIVVTNNAPQALEKSTYRISHMVVNKPIAPEVFKPEYERGVKVIQGIQENKTR